MSYQRTDPGAPSDLADDSPNRNSEFVKPHPYKTGINITTKAGKHCRSCGWQFDLKLEKCPDCGNSYLIEKWLKAGPVAQCPNAECKHKQDAPQPVETVA